MSYSADEKLLVKFFKETMEEKAEMIRKYLKEVDSTLVFTTYIRPNMATFKFYSSKEDTLKLHYTFSNLGDLLDQLYYLWIQLKYVLRRE